MLNICCINAHEGLQMYKICSYPHIVKHTSPNVFCTKYTATLLNCDVQYRICVPVMTNVCSCNLYVVYTEKYWVTSNFMIHVSDLYKYKSLCHKCSGV